MGRHFHGTKSLLSIKLLAGKVGINREKLLKFERNQEKPSFKEMMQIQDYLNIPTGQIKQFMPEYPRFI
jgi:transcriptional regulator with XRE-family HTH domain